MFFGLTTIPFVTSGPSSSRHYFLFGAGISCFAASTSGIFVNSEALTELRFGIITSAVSIGKPYNNVSFVILEKLDDTAKAVLHPLSQRHVPWQSVVLRSADG